jgi:hypothetical protein
VEYVAPTRTGVVIVAHRKGREYSINVPRSEIAALATKLRRPVQLVATHDSPAGGAEQDTQLSFILALTER